MKKTKKQRKMDSERAKRWLALHPDRAQAAKEKSREIKLNFMFDGICVAQKNKCTTPIKAIKLFCRKCPNGKSRCPRVYSNAPLYCEKPECVLWPFSNGNPFAAFRKLGIKPGSTKKQIGQQQAIEAAQLWKQGGESVAQNATA